MPVSKRAKNCVLKVCNQRKILFCHVMLLPDLGQVCSLDKATVNDYLEQSGMTGSRDLHQSCMNICMCLPSTFQS
jgi:hypothetical protein